MASYLMSILVPAKTLSLPGKFLTVPTTPPISRKLLLPDGEMFQNIENMIGNGRKNTDPNTLFLTSQNKFLGDEVREQAAQRLRDLSAGHVYVPPPTVQVTPSRGLTQNLDPSQDTPEGQASKTLNTAREEANKGTKKGRVTKNRPRKPIVIPSDAEIIVLSSGSENESSSVRKLKIRRRIYHPQNHTNDAWRCPVSTCTRHDPEFGFETNAEVERHIRNRHTYELVYPCISGCSIAFGNGREWERHQRDFHADEVDE